MLSQESLASVGAIIEAYQPNLNEAADHVTAAKHQVIAVEQQVATAEAAVKAAQTHLNDSKKLIHPASSASYAAVQGVEQVAKVVAVDILQSPDLDPVTKTLYSLTYADTALSRQTELAKAHVEAAEKGRVALASIIERLQPGEPVLYLVQKSSVVADTVTDEKIVAEVPALNHISKSYISIEGGSIAVDMDGAPAAFSIDDGLVKVEQQPEKAVLFSRNSRQSLDLMEAAATNESWLVIGAEAITAKLQTLEPMHRMVALTALDACGVEVPVEVDDEIKQQIEEKLVALVAFMAAGSPQETETHSVRTRDMWTGGSHNSQITQDLPLTRMAKNVDTKSLRHMANAIGLTVDDLRTKVQAVLTTRVGQDDTRLDQLAKDVRSLRDVDQILEIIFDTTSK